ncbi:hypothetical protein COB28_00990 [Candidatus Dependentiae bacterium]|nr:MAG: hypothetical protein COB28_00990 [Candidatus Dependentiae bacterium]
MNPNTINLLFKATLFGGILYQLRSFFMQYGYPVLKESHETLMSQQQKIAASIVQLHKNISSEKDNLVQTVSMLKLLEKKMDSWHNDIKKKAIQNIEQTDALYQEYIASISKQMQDHIIYKNQTFLIKKSSIDALNHIQQNQPDFFKEYTKKQIKLLDSEEKQR